MHQLTMNSYSSVVKVNEVRFMTKQEISRILDQNAQQRSGFVNGKEFGVDQGPFENSQKKYVAYLIDDYNGDFFFNTLDEFLDGFIIEGAPIGKQLKGVTSFSVDSCIN